MNNCEYFNKENIINEIKLFLVKTIDKNSIYNEFSFQYEFGIYLRDKLEKYGYRVEFERNIEYFNLKKEDYEKKEIDICVYKKDNDFKEKYAFELKYPAHKYYIKDKTKKMSGEYPMRMFQFIKDIKFIQELKNKGNFTKTFSIVLVDDRLFYENGITNRKKNLNVVYKYFRENNSLMGNFEFKYNGEVKSIDLGNYKYDIEWNKIYENNESRFYVVESKNNK